MYAFPSWNISNQSNGIALSLLAKTTNKSFFFTYFASDTGGKISSWAKLVYWATWNGSCLSETGEKTRCVCCGSFKSFFVCLFWTQVLSYINQYPEKRKIKFKARLTTTDKTELLTTSQQCDSYIWNPWK